MFTFCLVSHSHIAALANSKKTRGSQRQSKGRKCQQNWEKVKLCYSTVALHNFQTKRRGRKIGRLWFRPSKPCTNKLNSPVVWAIPLCSEGGTLAESGRKVWKDTVWATDALSAQTYQIWLLTAGVVHFCPTRLCRSAWLGENLSRCPSPPGTQELLPARPLLSYKNLLSELQRGKHLCIESWSSGGERWLFSTLLWPPLLTVRQESFPRWENTPLERHDHPPAPKTSPLAPLLSLPHTHTHSAACTHSQLGSRISGQQGRPENSRKHQKQLQRLFLCPCVSVWAWGVDICSALS